MDQKKIVLLIDAENTSAKFAEGIIRYMEDKGDVISSRIYGDFIDNNNTRQWNDKVKKYNLQREQTDTTKAGKNAADIALVIDAMDFLHQENRPDIFYIITSDGDFTRLVDRIRKEGIEVVGMGKDDASGKLRRACSTFVELEELLDKKEQKAKKQSEKTMAKKQKQSTKKQSEKKQSAKKQAEKQSVKKQPEEKQSAKKQPEDREEKQSAKKQAMVPIQEIKKTLNHLIQADENEGKMSDLGGIKSRLQQKYPGFDEEAYGYHSVRDLIDRETKFSVHQVGTHMLVESDKKTKAAQNPEEMEQVLSYILQCYPTKEIDSDMLGALGRRIKERFPKFCYKTYDCKNLSEFLEKAECKVVKKDKRGLDDFDDMYTYLLLGE